MQANNQTTNLGFDTITFDSSLANKPLLLTGGQMSISETVTIQGASGEQTIIDGQNNWRLFDITAAGGRCDL